jgi:predicted transcriptional regulator
LPRAQSARPEHILSMIDGRPYKVLMRHLKGHGLTPAQYHQRYGLPDSYPMVAPAFSEARRATAPKIGLGNKGRAGAKKSPRAASRRPAAAKRGRPRKGS